MIWDLKRDGEILMTLDDLGYSLPDGERIEFSELAQHQKEGAHWPNREFWLNLGDAKWAKRE